ncbi:DUF4974 domain-containing protein [Pseudoflavitalea sp. G-6-1-2]|uniref:FecR family protein n=1 Tax=Pseudoflavitalea sp. G-6-1-2 TaxID=2728841 RepID=UPI00146B77DB|nr:FecR family protein [Pseudoflavitalea sp. G-6-1-2]NML23587.1 DUF4974 domain-containing protein [Pseudoflavitalea sp. G-6-1-2]
MNKEALKSIAEKYLNGTASEKEIKMMQAWMLLTEQEDASLTDQERLSAKERIWLMIDPDAQDSAETTAKPMFRRISKRMMRYAAAVLLLTGLGSVAWIYRFPILDMVDPIALKSMQSGPYEIKECWLPDSTHVTLAAGSSISYPEKYRGARRFATLRGKAFFNVARDVAHPFEVESHHMKIKVLGTSFEVDDADGREHALVTVVTGKVQVNATRQQPALLGRNQQLKFNKKSGSIAIDDTIDAGSVTGWTTKSLSFNETPLAEVLKAVAVAYQLDIQPGQQVVKSSATFSGNFSRSEYWKDVLDIICMSSDLSWSVNRSNTIVIKK